MKICSVSDIKSLYNDGEFLDIAKNLPHMRASDDPLIRFLMASNLLKMKDWLKEKTLTIGADPEFIMCKKGTSEVVLFSSEHVTHRYNLSEAAVGADYGLLEMRTPTFTKPEELVAHMELSIKEFRDQYEKLDILKKEAVEFNHAHQRIRESMVDDSIDYGIAFHSKEQEMWDVDGAGVSIESMEIMNMTLSAYGKPIFNKPNDEIFSAGGHIHVGGAYVKMLSFNQLKALIVKIDQTVRPMCEAVETEAGELRRQVYGFPGEFRVKPYGFEYRSLSNAIFWEENSKVLLKILTTIIDTVKTFAIQEIT